MSKHNGMKYTSRSVRILIIVPVLAVGVPVWLTYRQIRQSRLDNSLITAVKQNDADAAIALLNSGADPDAQDLPVDTRPLWQRILNMVRLRRSTPHMATALCLATNADVMPDVPFQPGPVAVTPGISMGITTFDRHVPPSATIGKPYNAKLAIVRALLSHGARVNVRDEEGETPLMNACAFPQAEICQALLDRGADVNARRGDGSTALMHTETIPIVKALLAGGADVNAKDETGSTALMNAQNTEYARLLVDAGADINAGDSNGDTALTQATDVGIVRLLLAKGADVKARNKDKETALMGDDAPCSEALLSAGVEIDATDKDGDTALAWAVLREEVDTVKTLLAHGADPNIKNRAGRTALAQTRNKTIKTLLRKSGAK